MPTPRKSYPAILLLTASAFLFSCNDSSFQGKPKVITKQHKVSSSITEGTDKLHKVTLSVKDSLDFYLKAYGTKVIEGEDITTTRPVDLVISLDKTASMKNVIDEVKESINEIVSRLKDEGIDLKVGLVSYVDQILQPSFQDYSANIFNLTNDIDDFSRRLEKLPLAPGNKDFPEAGLWALQHSLELLEDSPNPNATKVVLALTDAPSHNGSIEETPQYHDVERDCDIEKTINKFNNSAFRLGGPEKLKFFYAAPVSIDAKSNCQNGQDKPRSQLQSIFERVMTSVPEKQRGGHLKDEDGKSLWPLTGGAFSESLISLIKTTTPSSNKSYLCHIQSAELEGQNGETLINYRAGEIDKLKNPEQMVQIGASLKGSQFPKGTTSKLTMNISRCCVAPGQKSLNSCDLRTRQELPVEIKSM